MRINPFAMPVLVVVALFGTVFTAQAMGQWSTSGRVAIDPAKMTAADLKGWMTLQDVMNGLGISQADLYAAGKIPSDVPPSTALNKLESLVPGFSVTTLRETLTAQLAGSSDSATSAPASQQTIPAATPNPASAPASTAVPTATPHVSGDDAGTGPTPLPAGQVLAASQIKGSMTLRSVSQQAGVTLDKLLAALKLPADTNPDTPIKDLVSQGKISEVTTVQAIVAELQGK